MKSKSQPQALDYAFQKAKRCGAKTRKGTPCQSPAVHGKNRCRMHGGAAGSGAPFGNKNALKHGYYSRESRQERQMLKKLIRGMFVNLDSIDKNVQ